ncbi:uncharacterized protein [Elaeis guineensis]|uniref:uncharacterized protein n=1 Tax=Elaeis guineensis var. tenera TaxID=51953 RepID=UPI003C6DAA83
MLLTGCGKWSKRGADGISCGHPQAPACPSQAPQQRREVEEEGQDHPSPSSDPIRSTTPPPPPPPLPSPPPPLLFHTYPSPSSTSSTPLPAPSMPRRHFLRRIMPFLLMGSGAYALMRNSRKESAAKDEKLARGFFCSNKCSASKCLFGLNSEDLPFWIHLQNSVFFFPDRHDE